MKLRDESIDREPLPPPPPPARQGNQLTAACAALAVAVLLWTFGFAARPHLPQAGASSRTPVSKLWDKHQDLTRAVAALLPTPSRRPPNAPTRVAAPCTAHRLASFGYRAPEERRPITLSPHLSQIHLRAPPALA